MTESGIETQAASGVRWNGLATGAEVLLQFITLAILARLLDPADFGLMSMAVVVTGFAALYEDAGVGNAIIYRQDATPAELSTLYWFNLVIGVLLFGAVYLVTPLAVLYFQEPALEPVLRWAAAAFLLSPWGHQFGVLLKRDLDFRTLGIIRVTENVVYSVSAVALAVMGLGVMSLVFGYLARAGTRALLLVGIAARRALLPRLHFAAPDLRRFASFGLFQLGDRSLNYLANNVDYLIVGRLLGAQALGFYMLAYNVVRAPTAHLNPVITSVAFPAFARVQDDHARLRRGYLQVVRYISSVTFPMMAGMLVVAPVFIPLVYGPEWTPAVLVTQIFTVLGAMKSLGNPTGSLFLAKGRADWGFYLNGVSLVALIGLNLLGSRWGIEGVAVSAVAFLILIFPVGVHLRRRLIGLRLGPYVRAFAPAALACAVMVGVTGAVVWVTPGSVPALLELLLYIAVGVATYGWALRRFDPGFFPEALKRLTAGQAPSPAGT